MATSATAGAFREGLDAEVAHGEVREVVRHQDGAVTPGGAGNTGVGGVNRPSTPGPVGLIATGPTSGLAVGDEEAQRSVRASPRLRPRGRRPRSTSAKFTPLVASVWPSASS